MEPSLLMSTLANIASALIAGNFPFQYARTSLRSITFDPSVSIFLKIVSTLSSKAGES